MSEKEQAQMSEQEQELRLDLAQFRLMYEDMVNNGASEKGLKKVEEMIRETQREIQWLNRET